jgi:hypothetical protein
MKISKKKIVEIEKEISVIFALNNIKEFEEDFEREPVYWSNTEKKLCDYTARIKSEILEMLDKVLNFSKEGR